jgi:hypothetical protein
MKEIIFTGMILLLAGCSHAITVAPTAESTDQEGWYSPEKSEQQLSEDLTQCKSRCVSA